MRKKATLEAVFPSRRKSRVKKKVPQAMLTLVALFLWVSPGLGEETTPECTSRDFRFCTSPCRYLREGCRGDAGCAIDLCSYLHPSDRSDLERCWDLFFECNDDYRVPTKRRFLNRDLTYLLLKLHPIVNKTSQFGFLTSGRFRRISSSLGTEFLGKRGNNKPKGGDDKNKPKPKPTPQFYSLPLNKLSKTKILKREEEFQGLEKRQGLPGNGRVVLGSEFLGKRGEGSRSFTGNEFLGKRDGGEFLEGTEFLGKRDQEDLLGGTEFLGKKSSDYGLKRYGNELLGKRLSLEELLGYENQDNERLTQGFSGYQLSNDK